MTMMDGPEIKAYSIAQVAEALGVSALTVRRLIAAGKLGAIKVGGSHRIMHTDLDAFIAANRIQTP